MKIVQVPMDEGLLKAVTGKAKASRLTRAAFIRRACQEQLRRGREEELERQYVEGYRRKPEKASPGKAGERLAAEVWKGVDSDEAW